jgi:Predicted membrane protein (DUF2207) C-terminal domain
VNEPNTALSAAAAAVSVLGLLFLGLGAVITRPRRPHKGAATMDLGDEPPAIVDVLTDHFEVTPESVPATLVDLAARRWVALDEIAPGQTICRIRRRAGQGELTEYEHQVLDHVKGLAVDGQVPAQALTTGPGGASQAWWKRFRSAVLADARSRGLARRRWPKLYGTLGVAAAVGAGVALWAATGGKDSDTIDYTPLFAVAVAGVIALVLAAGAVFASDRHRDTALGLDVAGRWLGVREYLADNGRFQEQPPAAVAIWDRYLAQATALDLAPLVVRDLPLGAEDDVHAWSSEGGRWRQVDVDYFKLRPGWGHHPLWAAFSGLVVAAVSGFAAVRIFAVASDVTSVEVVSDLDPGPQQWVKRVALGVSIALLVLGLWWLLRFVNGVIGLAGRREVRGIVLRKRLRGGKDDYYYGRSSNPVKRMSLWIGRQRDREPRRYLAIDDGSNHDVDALRATPDAFASVEQGAQVVAKVAPRVGYLFSIERAPAAPAAPAPGAATVARAPADADPALLAAAQRLVAARGSDTTEPA